MGLSEKELIFRLKKGFCKAHCLTYLLLVTCISSLDANEVDIASHQILFLAKNGQQQRAFEMYDQLYSRSGSHWPNLLQEIGLQLLFEGNASKDPEVLLLTLYGAGISSNERVFPILESAFKHPAPQQQLVALSFLAGYQNDRADSALMEAMRSDFLPIRLEAAFALCQKQSPGAVGQAESLMHKLPIALRPLFAQLFAAAGTHAATRHLKQLMSDSSSHTRIAAILSAAAAGRDDLLPQIRTLSAQLDTAQQEACAFVFGAFKDESSRPRLLELAQSAASHVQVAALHSLYYLGNEEAGRTLCCLAKGGDLFAIAQLADVADSEETLQSLLSDSALAVRINATLSLLKQGDPRCLQGVREVLVTDSRDLIFTKQESPGKSMIVWKPIPCASQQKGSDALNYELSLAFRERVTSECMQLPEEHFLALAHLLFEMRQNDLVPIITHLLENMQTPGAIELLKAHSQQAGAPLIRNYCNLALYRLQIPGPYYTLLKNWIDEEKESAFIKLRPALPANLREQQMSITAEERSRLLIEAFESFVKTHDDRGIDILLNAIRTGNPKNRYALAGLLIQNTL